MKRREKNIMQIFLAERKGGCKHGKKKMFSYGGKEVLLISVLQSIPIYVVSAIVPPICVIKELHRIFVRIF